MSDDLFAGANVAKALDLFAGAGGWDVAALDLGIDVDGVEIMPAARATRDAAGLSTVCADVRDVFTTYTPEPFDLLIASPPCQTFSMAGSGSGRKALDAVLAGVDAYGSERPPSFDDLAGITGDERTALVLEPLRIALAAIPTFIAWEQVPAVLPVWQACAEVLRSRGYSVATGVLNAEQYGVPQTRRRAVLVARRDGRVALLPTPTHSRYYSRDPHRLDDGVAPWVSMAEALGWGTPARPYPTVATGTAAGGTDPAAVGGSGARKILNNARNAPDWVQRSNYSGPPSEDRVTAEERGRTERELDAPSLTVTGKGFRWAMRAGHRANAAVRGIDEPAPTIIGGHDTARRVWTFAGAGATAEQTAGQIPRDLDEPAHTVTGKGTAAWRCDAESAEPIRVSVEEAATLQTFPDGFPWEGNKGDRFQQIGNAVPPLLARAVLSTITDPAAPAVDEAVEPLVAVQPALFPTLTAQEAQ